MIRTTVAATITTAITLFLTACASAPQMPVYSQASLPEAVKVPSGHLVALEAIGVGKITYECRAKKDVAAQFEWVFVGPEAVLKSRSGSAVGKYYGPPATWEAADGSKITGTQLAIAPAAPGNIPLQLVKANPAMGAGAMSGMAYIQRVATRGGVAPASLCDATIAGKKELVSYQSDYIFWKSM